MSWTKLSVVLVMGGLALGTPQLVSAGVFSTADLLPSRTFMLGIEPMVTPAAGPAYDLFLHGGLGLSGGADLQMRLGVPIRPDGPLYVGGEVQIKILADQEGAPGISMILGGHGEGWQSFGMDAALIISKDFGKVSPYLGVDSDLEFQGNSINPEVYIVPGMKVDIAKPTSFYWEIGFGAVGPAATYVSAGFQFRI